MWEAQFGDFNNGAQIIIDQYIAASEDKWKQTSRLTMLLPHGYEGQGPEHSSARLERFLQLCAENNLAGLLSDARRRSIFICCADRCSDGFERPLIVMTPKSLLRLAGGGFVTRSIDERRIPSGVRRCRDQRSKQRRANRLVQRKGLL